MNAFFKKKTTNSVQVSFLACHCEERSDVAISWDHLGTLIVLSWMQAACTGRLPRACGPRNDMLQSAQGISGSSCFSSTSVPDASGSQGTLPRPKNSPPDCFYPGFAGDGLSSPACSADAGRDSFTISPRWGEIRGAAPSSRRRRRSSAPHLMVRVPTNKAKKRLSKIVNNWILMTIHIRTGCVWSTGDSPTA